MFVDFSYKESIAELYTSTILKSYISLYSLPTDKKENDDEKNEAEQKKVDGHQDPIIKQEDQTKAKYNLTMHSGFFLFFRLLIYLFLTNKFILFTMTYFLCCIYS